MGTTNGRTVERLLVIDDDLDDSLIFKEALQQIDPSILFLALQDAAKVVNIIKDFNPDLVFTDMNMPGITGLECIKMIKAAHSDLPVVIYSGSEDEEVINDAFEQGAALVFQKPHSFNTLISGLRVLLGLNWQDKEWITARFYGKIINLTSLAEQKRTG